MFPLSTSSNNICCKEALMNIDNFKKRTWSSTKHCNSRNFSILQKVLQNVLSFFTNLSQGNFLCCPKFFIQLKMLILPVLILKWIKTYCIDFFLIKIFVSIVKLLNISLDEYSLFLSHVKSVFFNDDSEWTENTILVLLSWMIIIKLLCMTTKIQLPKLRFKERV